MMYTGNEMGMRPVLGMFINPKNNNEWSSQPYDATQRKYEATHKMFYDILNKIDSDFAAEYEKIKQKKSRLSNTEIQFVKRMMKTGEVNHFDQRGLREIIDDAVNHVKK